MEQNNFASDEGRMNRAGGGSEMREGQDQGAQGGTLRLFLVTLQVDCSSIRRNSLRPIISHTQLAKMSFDKIFDLTAGVCFYFYIYFYI